MKSKRKKFYISLFIFFASIQVCYGVKEQLRDFYGRFKREKETKAKYEKIMEYLRENESLSLEEKEIFANETLLYSVLPYYDMDYFNQVVCSKYDGLHFSYFDCYYENDVLDSSVLGHYKSSVPNEIGVKKGLDEETKYDVVTHEYGHLLQFDVPILDRYSYLREACAEIITNEFNEAPIHSYKVSVKNVKALMEIVGPDLIWEYNFTGKSDKLFEIFESYLSEEDAKRLKSLFWMRPSTHVDNEVYDLISKLYFNVYGKSIYSDIYMRGIYLDVLVDRYYFNEEKILKRNPQFLEGKGKCTVSKNLTYKEYIVLKEIPNIEENISVSYLSGESHSDLSNLEEDVREGRAIIFFRKVLESYDGDLLENYRKSGYSVLVHDTRIDEEVIEEYLAHRDNLDYALPEEIVAVVELENIKVKFSTSGNKLILSK